MVPRDGLDGRWHEWLTRFPEAVGFMIVRKEKEMGTTKGTGEQWTSTQVYVVIVVCLAIGIGVGYLLHTPPAVSVNPAVQGGPQTAPSLAPNQAQVTREQLAQIVDKQAEPLLTELQTHPNDPQLLLKIGNLYLAGHQPQIAQKYYERSLAANGADPTTLIQLASSYYYQGDADNAIANLQRALAIDSGNAQALFELGMIRFRAKDPKGAVEMWEKLLKSHPDHPNRARVERWIAQAKRQLSLPAGNKTARPEM